MAFGGLAHVMRQRPAAPLPLGDHHVAAQPRQQPDRRVVDVRVERPLRAAGHQRHAHLAFALRREHLRIVVAADRRDLLRRHGQHRLQPRIGHQEGEGPPDLGAQKRHAEPRRVGQDPRQRPAQHALEERASVGLLDVFPRMVDEMHVMHARGAGRHAGEAAEAAVDMLDRLLIGRAPVLQHILYKIYPPPRTVEFIAQHLVGRTGRRAEPAVNAGPQDLVRPLDRRILELFWRERGLHFRAFR
jgi:hypothetical protein